MHRFRSWTLDPPEYRTQRNRLLPIEGGDGSTLNLDFTTGVLDPRLTFTRLSDATFINSSGLVQWAEANRGPRTNWAFTNPAGSGWNAATTAGTGTFQWVGDGTVIASSGTSGQAYTFISGATQIAQGIRYVMSVTAQSVTGSPTIQSIFDFTNASGNTYFKNGATANATTTVASGDRISVSAIADSTGMNIRMGCGAWFADRTNESVTLTRFHWHPGAAPVPYYENTTGSPRYDSARFDYDPTTLAPRGLLIEGSAVNTIYNSNTIYTGAWGGSFGITATQDTTIPDPSGGTTTCKIVKASTYQYVVRNQPIPTLTVPANSTVHLTISVWLRMDGANQVAASLGIYDGAGASFGTRSGASVSNSAVTISSGSSADAEFTFGTVTGWVRCSISRSFTNSTGSSITFPSLQFYIYPNRLNTNATTIYAWGAQVETGVGPTSLIPTGASTGNRAADVCYMANADYGFSTSGGTYLAEWHRGSNISTAGGGTNAFATDYANGRWLGIYTSGASSTGTAGSWAGYLNSSGAVSGINKMAVSYSSWVASASGNASLNGGAIVSGTLTLGTTPTYLFVGAASGTSPYSGGGYRDPLNNCVRRIKYWPSVLQNAQLQSLTT